MNGNRRSAAPAPTLNPPAPTINSPQYGPIDPLTPVEPSGPTLDGPVLDGPAFPPSSEGFHRKRHSQKSPDGHKGSEYAGTSPPPFIPDGPIANEKPNHSERIVGFSELPPAP
jgi:hypothetical protein